MDLHLLKLAYVLDAYEKAPLQTREHLKYHLRHQTEISYNVVTAHRDLESLELLRQVHRLSLLTLALDPAAKKLLLSEEN